MKRIKVLFLAALLTVGLMGIAPRVEAANWVWAYSTDYSTIRIDADNCHWINGKLSFWSSEYYIDSHQRNRVISELQYIADEDGKNVDYSNFRESVYHIVMYRANNGTFYSKTIYIIYYDNDGNVIDRDDFSSSNFSAIPSETVVEREYNVAAGYAQ